MTHDLHKDVVGLDWEDIQPHVEDSIRNGDFEMSKKTIRVSDTTFRAIAHEHGFVCDDEIAISDADIAYVWGELQAVPSYVERLSVMPQADYEACLLQSPIPVVMEDEIIHFDDAPFCVDPDCPCHIDAALFEQHIYRPVVEGKLKIWEAQALLWPEQ
jgi:hypothetical protein